MKNFLAATTSSAILLLIAGYVQIAVAQSSSSANAPATDVAATESAAQDWLSWRGPNHNGIVENQSPPIKWDRDQNVLWKTKLPGSGHASPTIVGNRILLATAVEKTQTQSVVAFDRSTGKQLWSTDLHVGKLTKKIHKKNTYASQTVVSDGKLAFAVFENDGKIWVTALDLDGNKAWQKSVGNYRSGLEFGFGTSPNLQDGKLLVTSESEAESFLLALNPSDGTEIYRIDRGNKSSYSVPVIATVAGKPQLLLSGLNTVQGYDPETGESLWSAPTKWQFSCGTMVVHEDLAFASGGYPGKQTLAVRADGSGEIVWQNPIKVYEQSMIVVDGYLYGLAEKGIMYCWRCSDGKEMWKERLQGPESASPVLAGGHLYLTNEIGTTFVLKPNPEKMEMVAKNQLGDSSFASMAMVDNRIYTRVAHIDDNNKRVEWLYCLGAE